jgi:hypothetical protein
MTPEASPKPEGALPDRWDYADASATYSSPIDYPTRVVYAYDLRCSHGRKYDDNSKKDTGERNGSTRMKGCKWKAVLWHTLGNDLEEDSCVMGWDLEVADNTHNQAFWPARSSPFPLC